MQENLENKETGVSRSQAAGAEAKEPLNKTVNYARGICLGITQKQSGDSHKESTARLEKLVSIDFVGSAGDLLESLAQAVALKLREKIFKNTS